MYYVHVCIHVQAKYLGLDLDPYLNFRLPSMQCVDRDELVRWHLCKIDQKSENPAPGTWGKN